MGLFRRRPLRGLERVLRGADAPHLPELAFRILERIRDPEASLDEVTEALQWDPGLVVRVLRTANSAAFGAGRPIHDLGHAATFLGRGRLEQLVLALAVRDALPDDPAPGYDPSRFWRAAARRAALARLLAERLHPAHAAECFVGGLLQDVAVPVLARARPDDYGPVLERWHDDRAASLDALERDAFGWTHGEVGALLARAWCLPARLGATILAHHDGEERRLPPALRLVSLLGELPRADEDARLVEAAAGLGLDAAWTERALDEAERGATELAATLAA